MSTEYPNDPGHFYGANKKITGNDYDKSMAVGCRNGIFVGTKLDDISVWRGIPFAKPPVGNLRFMAPVRPDDSSDVYEAYNYGKKPLVLLASDNEYGSEDCLYLNVFTGSDGKKNKPVMVWIHGGAFSVEAASDPYYQGNDFAKMHPDIVLVTVEYRLNIFGFLNYSDIEGGQKGSENNGLRDQIMALRWVKENIAGFGGDPENVTLFGESAGGFSCSLLSVCDEAKGLFQKTIIQSGAANTCLPYGHSKPAAKVICELTGSKNMADLQKLDAADIIAHASEIVAAAPMTAPELDGDLLPADPLKAFDEGKASHLKIMVGYTANECRYFIPLMNKTGGNENGEMFDVWMKTRYDSLKKYMTPEDIAIADAYIAKTGLPVTYGIESLMTELSFGAGTRVVAESAAKHSDTYLYYYAYPTHIAPVCAEHSAELEPLFGHDFGYLSRTGDYEGLCRSVGEVWTSFAKTGTPTIGGTPAKKHDGKDMSCIVFGEDGKTTVKDRHLAETGEAVKGLLKYAIPAVALNFSPPAEDYALLGVDV